jgi:large subunit ribosomal protein L11
MAKKVKAVLKLNLKAGAANPAPPVGPILGQAGINIMDFCSQYNEKTKDKRGEVIPALITVYEDRSFTFVLKLPPMSALIMKELNLKQGAANVKTTVAGTLTEEQVRKIAEIKMPDTNATSIEAVMTMVRGSARSMGVKVQE